MATKHDFLEAICAPAEWEEDPALIAATAERLASDLAALEAMMLSAAEQAAALRSLRAVSYETIDRMQDASAIEEAGGIEGIGECFTRLKDWHESLAEFQEAAREFQTEDYWRQRFARWQRSLQEALPLAERRFDDRFEEDE